MDFCQKAIEYGEVRLNSELLPATFWGFYFLVIFIEGLLSPLDPTIIISVNDGLNHLFGAVLICIKSFIISKRLYVFIEGIIMLLKTAPTSIPGCWRHLFTRSMLPSRSDQTAHMIGFGQFHLFSQCFGFQSH